jgi:hypothetical protein
MDDLVSFPPVITLHLQSKIHKLVKMIVAGGSDTQHINFNGIGRKQMGQPSLAGGSLNSASSRSSAARDEALFFSVAQ